MKILQYNATMTDRSGQCIGKYRLLRPLSLNRAWGIYVGEHTTTGMQQMVKVWEMRLEESSVNVFVRQVEKLKKLHHPHILPVCDGGVEQAVPYVIMQYIDHVSLQQSDSRGVPQPLAGFLPALKSIAEALQYAHNNGILHKHIQPANILLASNARVYISNFGIDAIDQSKEQPPILKKEDVVECLGYIAPEQIHGYAVPASDQYGLAIVIYEWLSGKLPFTGTYSDVAQQHRHSLPPSLCKENPNIPRAVEETLFKALAKEPEDRFPSIRHFVEALQAAHMSAVVPITPVSPLPDAFQQPMLMQSYNTAPMDGVPTQPAKTSIKPTIRQKRPQRQSITRRTFLIGLLGAAAISGGAAWLGFGEKQPHGPAAPPKTPGVTTTATSDHAAQGNIYTYTAHQARVGAVAWSPDGKRIASASDDQSVLICDALKGKTLLSYRGHSNAVLALAWSPNGRYIASGSADKTVQIWDTTTGKTISTFTGHKGQVNAVSWSHQNSFIASGSDDSTVQVWNAMTQEVFLMYTGHKAGVLATAWSPDDAVIASGSWDNTVQAFSTIDTISFLLGETIFKYEGHGAEVYSVCWSPDGTKLASASGDKLVTVQNGQNGNTIFHYAGHSDIVYAVAWSPNGKYVVSGGADNTAQVWSANTKQGNVRQSLFTYYGHSNIVYTVNWSPDGSKLASGSADNTMQVWQMI
jgi:WD40 repeat protein/serine/threonine protein kinase